MMSPSRALSLTLVLYLSLVVAFVNARDDLLHQRGLHDYNMKRTMMRKRAPLPQGPGSVISPNPLPISSVVEPTSTGTPRRDPVSTTSSSTTSLPSSTSSGSRLVLSSTSSTTSSSVSQRSASPSLVIESSSPPPQFTSTTDDGTSGVSTIIEPGGTRTSSVSPSATVVPDKQGNASSAKNTTLTVLIAIAASVGGIAILWTIFRKWKLSSSKEFDRRLNPIDWQPTTGEDEQIPGLTRRPSIGSLHSSGHGHGAAGVSRAPSDHSHSNPFDDFDPVQQSAPVQVGGYADLARGSSPTQMQERAQYGPSYNHGVTPLPLHHQSGY